MRDELRHELFDESPTIYYGVDELIRLGEEDLARRTRLRRWAKVVVEHVRIALNRAPELLYLARHPMLLRTKVVATAQAIAEYVEPRIIDDKIALLCWYGKLGHSASANRKRREWRAQERRLG